jgi:hypothetical protein
MSFKSDDEYTIEDWDVESYYPSLAIANGLYPEHLGEAFVKVYADMKNDRTSLTSIQVHPVDSHTIGT